MTIDQFLWWLLMCAGVIALVMVVAFIERKKRDD